MMLKHYARAILSELPVVDSDLTDSQTFIGLHRTLMLKYGISEFEVVVAYSRFTGESFIAHVREVDSEDWEWAGDDPMLTTEEVEKEHPKGCIYLCTISGALSRKITKDDLVDLFTIAGENL